MRFRYFVNSMQGGYAMDYVKGKYCRTYTHVVVSDTDQTVKHLYHKGQLVGFSLSFCSQSISNVGSRGVESEFSVRCPITTPADCQGIWKHYSRQGDPPRPCRVLVPSTIVKRSHGHAQTLRSGYSILEVYARL